MRSASPALIGSYNLEAGSFTTMASFRSAARMASDIMKQVQGDEIQSVGTVRMFEERLSVFAESFKAEHCEHIKHATPEQCQSYLADRAAAGMSQKTLDADRLALNCLLRVNADRLGIEAQSLERQTAQAETVLTSRAYTPDQISGIVNHQSERNALATEIAAAAGLRAHELLTLRPASERPMDERPADGNKFRGMEGERYTVEGKGGLCREVVIPSELAARLEERRLDTPALVTDRGVHYRSHYDIGGGNAWSRSVTDACTRAGVKCHGAHGLRHTYAQERMDSLSRGGIANAKEVVSQELGHFRESVTDTYLR